jgi:hypothetical protein
VRSTKINGKTCAVCDEEKPSVPLPGEDKLFRKLLPSELPSRAYIVLLLGADHGYPEELLAQYNVAGLFSDTTERALVKPLLLSPRGIVTDGAANAQEEHAARSNRLNVYQLLHIFEGSPKCKATTASNCKWFCDWNSSVTYLNP